MQSVTDILKPLFDGLTSRQEEIVQGRFGVGTFSEPQTLAALGDRYGITRERVRQIEAGALKILEAKVLQHPACVALLDAGVKELKSAGGVLKQDALLAKQKSVLYGVRHNHLLFMLAASNRFFFRPEDDAFHSFYYLNEKAKRGAVKFIDQWVRLLRSKKQDILSGRYAEALKKFVAGSGIPAVQAENYLAITKKIAANPYGDVGLAEWPEVSPMTIRDRIYLVLKKKNEPLHFATIAATINEAGFNRRPAFAPTVHNELIKDPRFVLVGRGMYGLSEHGYEPGTAKEVIHRVLKREGPLHASDVVTTIQKERFFKPNTILVNLQNKNLFRRLDDGRYHVREA